MKTQILNKLNQIKEVAEMTNMSGNITLEFTGCTIKDWDCAVESITEFPRHRHFISVSENLTVALLLG